MKKLITVPVIFILILSLLAGCTDNDNNSASSEGVSSSAVESILDSEASVSEAESSVSSEASVSEDESSSASKESITLKGSSASDESDTEDEETSVQG